MRVNVTGRVSLGLDPLDACGEQTQTGGWYNCCIVFHTCQYITKAAPDPPGVSGAAFVCFAGSYYSTNVCIGSLTASVVTVVTVRIAMVGVALLE